MAELKLKEGLEGKDIFRRVKGFGVIRFNSKEVEPENYKKYHQHEEFKDIFEEVDQDPFKGMKVPELKKMAKDLGIEIEGNLKKAQLVELIVAAQNQTEENE